MVKQPAGPRDPLSHWTHSGEELHGVLSYLQDCPHWDFAGFGLPLPPGQTLLHLKDLTRGGIAGVLIEGMQTNVVALCRERGIPVVGTSRYQEDSQVPSVCSDDWAIGRLAARYFLQLGFRSLAFCGPDYLTVKMEASQPNLGLWLKRRLEGFMEVAEKAGAHCSVLSAPCGRPSKESDEACIQRYSRDLRQWVRELKRPVGILGCADTWAAACLQASQEEGLRVPHEVAVLGVDNTLVRCLACQPSLSSVDRNMRRIGYEAAALLGGFLQGKGWASHSVLVPPTGVAERLSTETLAVDDPKLASALRFVRAHFSEPISPVDVARAAGISESCLRRRFHSELGFSLTSEIRRLRLEKACNLLAAGDLPLRAVAEATGFHSETYLCRVFAQELGVSPSAWRRSPQRHHVWSEELGRSLVSAHRDNVTS